MRVGFAFVRRIVAGLNFRWVAAAIFLLSACQGSGPGYLQYGMGAQLPAADIARATELQNRYFLYLCQQAGFPRDCVLPLYDQGMWTLIVHQGMNDIDRRCDAYLQWLDNKKRSKGPILSQVNDVQAATTSILSLVDPTNATSLQIVAIAFNLVTRSIENYHSRLLDQIESSTINAIVLRARHDFRANTRNTRYSNRPDAEYALREYMRRCLPFAIETQINDLSTLGSRGISTAQDNTIFQAPVGLGQVIGDPSAGPERQFRADDRRRGGDTTVSEPISGAVTGWEKQIQPQDLAVLQDYLCIASPTTSFGPKTRAGILMLGLAEGTPGADENLNEREGGALLTTAKREGACDKSKYANVFERVTFTTLATETDFYRKLAVLLNENDPIQGEKSLADARPLIKRYYELNSSQVFPGASETEVTPRMFKRINITTLPAQQP